MKMKKLLSVVLVIAMLFAFCACTVITDTSNDDTKKSETADNGQTEDKFVDYTAVPYTAPADIYDRYIEKIDGVDVSEIKIGVITVGDEAEGYTLAHINGVLEMAQILGIDADTQIIFKKNIPEGKECLDAAKELVADGCQIIFANSFGHEDYMIKAAKKYPEVMFCHATGYQAASSGLDNMANYFNNVYESRYVSGIYAGYKLKELMEEKPEIVHDNTITIGYVGAHPYAEVISGFTSFYLGAKSVFADTDVNLEMKVTYTGSWADHELENNAAKVLIEEGCVLISQHADTTGAAAACEAEGVYDVGYNVTMVDAAPNFAITSATLNWASYYTYAISTFLAGEKIATDWSEGYETGAVKITEVNKAAFSKAETYNAAVEAANEAIEKIIAGELHVFDTSTFTVGGKKVSTTTKKYAEQFYGLEYIMKDENTGAKYFAESTLASAPSFSFIIDGIIDLSAK